ncbi:MAG: hypothetical protein RMX68_010565 [Aulosira sp. ZfuVER01]|nr:hypothetical protein [Aulosira sp. ZfuVER01]MDZ8001714.1 hypothetical protein [Aulosira sp. DedVER01a]MDZ8053787.1 hypothetical protein [Aulosira sp. ZfuCHP01]
MQNWLESQLKKWSKSYATAINLDEEIVYKDVQEGQQQRPQKLFPVSEEAMSDDKLFWDNAFNEDITKCK